MELYSRFLESFSFEPTTCQDGLFRMLESFLYSSDGDILVVNGYAGSGKTSAISSAIRTLVSLRAKCVLLAPTGRSAKVFSSYSGLPAYTIHKYIYRQQMAGFGQFVLAPNKARNTVFFVDEVSLLGIDSSMREGGAEAVFGSGNLLRDLVEFVRNGNDCRLVLIGDSAQLPPVGLDRSPALDPDYMMACVGGAQFYTLKTVVRQAHDSGILHNATLLRDKIVSYDGDPVPVKFSIDGFDDIFRIDGSELIDTLSSIYADYGQEGTVVLTRSNKRAIRYNLGIRSRVMYAEDRLLRGDYLMVVKNNYLFAEREAKADPSFKLSFIANGDIARLERVRHFENRYGLEFADATLTFPDYDDLRMENVKVILDSLTSESPSLTSEQQKALFEGVIADYADLPTKKDRFSALHKDPYYNALQLKYASAITAHKSQGGGWGCVVIDYSFFEAGSRDYAFTLDELKWLYTALTRATEKVYLVSFPDEMFI